MRIVVVALTVAVCYGGFAQDPVKKAERPLAETGPRAQPVKQPDPAEIDRITVKFPPGSHHVHIYRSNTPDATDHVDDCWNGIDWDRIPWRTSPTIFKRLKEEIVRLKDEGRVLMRFNELPEIIVDFLPKQ